MNKRIKKKKLKQFKQWIKNNVKITYSVERLDNGYCKVCAIIKEQEHEFSNWCDKDEVSELIDNMPSADVVEVVRCKDCKWRNKAGCALRIVDDSDKPSDDDYCSYGERKE